MTLNEALNCHNFITKI
jgi:glycogen synthase